MIRAISFTHTGIWGPESSIMEMRRYRRAKYAEIAALDARIQQLEEAEFSEPAEPVILESKMNAEICRSDDYLFLPCEGESTEGIKQNEAKREDYHSILSIK